MNISLPRKTQLASGPKLFKIVVLTAVGFALLMDQAVMLLALHYQASDEQMSFLFAAIHIMALTGPLVPLLFRRLDMVQVYAGAWILRSIVGLGYLCLPFAPLSAQTKLIIVIILHYLVCCFRAIGVVVYHPVVKALTPKDRLKSTMAKLTEGAFLGSLGAKLLAFVCLTYAMKIYGEENLLVTLIIIGALCNLYSGKMAFSLPFVGSVMGQEGKSLRSTLGEFFRNKTRKLVAAVFFFQIISIIMQSYLLNYFKNFLGFSTDQVFMLGFFGVFCGLLSSKMLAIIGSRISTKFLMRATQLTGILMAMVWTSFPWMGYRPDFLVCLILNGITTVALGASFTILAQIKAGSLPQNNSTQVAVIYQLFITLGAVCSTLLVKGINLRLHDLGSNSPQHYYYYFFFWAAACALTILMSHFLFSSKKNIPALGELSLLWPSNLRDMAKLYRLEHGQNNPNDRLVLEGIIARGTLLSRDLLEDHLDSANVADRYMAFRMMNYRPYKSQFKRVLEEARTIDSPLRRDAITTLGFLGEKLAVEDLVSFLDDPDPAIVATSIKSLARLNFCFNEAEVKALYWKCPSSAIKLQILLGMAHCQNTQLTQTIVAEELKQKPSKIWACTLMQYLALHFDKKETIVSIFNEIDKDLERGFDYLLSELEETNPLGQNPDALAQVVASEDWETLWGWLSSAKSSHPLIAALRRANSRPYDFHTALGLIYLAHLE